MEIQTARRRLETIAAHVSAAGNTSATHLFPLIIIISFKIHSIIISPCENCSGGLASVKRRCDNSMHFAKQDSESQGCFMRPNSTEQNCSGGLASVKRRCDNSMHFAKQDSESQGCFMRPNSTEQVTNCPYIAYKGV
ncbi:hypothetical protein HanPI659440_Chr17g0698991 [Helianthus annuus]|nr:hypothetical protein HanPI659440_Chr17g0698991 [Helianthus annuus]